MDYYSLLGVDKNASQADIKKAYRKRAKELHPDRNPDDAASESKFKETTEAYNILSDAEKRKVYDQYGSTAFDGKGQARQPSNPFGGFADFGGFSDIFETFFGGRPSSHHQNLDLFEEITLSIDELITGTRRKIKIPGRQVECSPCSGKGFAPGSKPTICPDCHGHGSITADRGFMTFTQTCSTCQGAGSIIKYPCTTCNGSGFSIDNSEKTIDIPYGLRPGQTIRISGGGHSIGGKTGSLYLKILVQSSSMQISGENLLKEVPICCLDACSGATIPVKTFDGIKKVKIPPGVQSGTKIKMHGLGLPKSTTDSDRGHMYIVITLTVPYLNEKDQKKIKAIKEVVQ
jgi:molecular chaperone DnaJ